MKKYLIFVLLIFLISCSLDKSNPLDPDSSGINAPRKVTGIVVATTPQKQIKITWDIQEGVNGYYIYRSQSYDGYYIRIDEDQLNIGTADNFTDTTVMPGNGYWYKMSAYKTIDDKNLEGYHSDPKWRYIE